MQNSYQMKNTDDVGVYDRLFNDAQKKKARMQLRVKEKDQCLLQKRTLSSSNDSKWFDNFYRKGVEKSQELKLRADKIKHEKDQELMEECTYHP